MARKLICWLGDDEPFDIDAINEPTANELGNAFIAKVEEARQRVLPPLDGGAAAREFSLSITHAEDALTRYNSGRYRGNGTWKRADPDLG